MESVALTKDLEGNITGIRIEIKDNPELAGEIYYLMRAIARAKETEKAQTFKQASAQPHGSLSNQDVLRMIGEAKDSGEVSEEAFFQLHPTWRRSEKLSSLS